MTDKKIYPLSKVTKAIERLISEHAGNYFWVKAEIVKLNYYKQSGHCYPVLVEKEDDKIIAEIRGNIWKTNFEKINNKFKAVLNETLGDNMTVVLYAKVQYHSVYGLSLNIIDIDPAYTLGELAKQKAETIKRLKEENIFDRNKHQKLPLLPKIIAVISVSTSKGYQDFINVIDNNPWQYKFQHLLFPAVLQGERAIETIINQLNKISNYSHIFDAVAIIRGGGGEVGLSSFDDYRLARAVATYPIPVLTGIGHSTNETVTEMVSYKSFITPTKIGEFLLQQYHNFSVPLNESITSIKHYYQRLVTEEKNKLKATSKLFGTLVDNLFKTNKMIINQNIRTIHHYARQLLQTAKNDIKRSAGVLRYTSRNFILNQNHTLKTNIERIKHSSERILDNEQHFLNEFANRLNHQTKSLLEHAGKDLKFVENTLQILSPLNILKRGYSITRINGKILQDINKINSGDIIETELYNGLIESRVEQTKSKK